MHARMTIGTIIFLAALVITLYDVEPEFVFSLPGEIEQIAPAQETLFAQCYEMRDEQLHNTAFGKIDNPDVQKEFINISRAEAKSECRDEYPQQWITIRQPFVLKLLDLQPRYW